MDSTDGSEWLTEWVYVAAQLLSGLHLSNELKGGTKGEMAQL